jgi:glycosyltransferase involved in cell wall biosynthesis
VEKLSTLTPRPKKSSRPKRQATFYCVKVASDVRWRVELPVRHLKARLVSMSLAQASGLHLPGRKGFLWRETEEGAEYPEHEGVAVWTRPCQVRALHAAAMSANGIRTLAEVDDNYLSDPNQNIFMRQGGFDRETRERHMQALASFDGIVFSTQWLQDEYQKTFRKELRLAPPGFVARNHVDPDDWERRQPMLPPRQKVRVGWMGSHQHIWDLRHAAPALRLAKDYGCEIVFIGLDPASHDPKWREFLGDYTHVPWASPRLYHKTKINLDIGIIPLVMNKHTLGKSDVKFLEYAMSGVATIAQNNSVYNKTIIHGETGLLAGSPDEMAFAVADLIKNARPRQELAKAAKQYVLEHRSMAVQGVREWKQALEG